MINNMFSRKASQLWLVLLVAFLSTIFIFIYHFGYGVLIPTNYGWLLKDDWAEHFLGWHFYRSELWDFPLGTIKNYYYPIGTSIAYTDSIPLLAIPLKLLNSLLPYYFQYFGIWFFLNYIFQAFFAYKLFENVSITIINRIFLVLFFVFSPLLTFKTMHPALCAHWLILGTLWCNLLIVDVNKSIIYQFTLLILSSLIHPYICILIIGFTVALIVKWYLKGKLDLKGGVILITASLILVVLIWYLVGYFIVGVGKNMGSGGFSWFSLNLNALINNNGFTKLGLELPLLFGQKYEGFNYLGFGMIILAFLCLCYYIFTIHKVKKKFLFSSIKKKHLPFLIVAFIFTLIAITNKVTFNKSVLLSVPLTSTVENMLAPFRASARFFWPVYYFIFFIILYYVSIKIKNQLFLSSILFFTFVVQLIDIHPIFSPWNIKIHEYEIPLNKTEWDRILNHIDKLILYPPLQRSVIGISDDYRYFAIMADAYKIPLTAGYVSRTNTNAVLDYTKNLEGDLNRGDIDNKAVYITHDSNLVKFGFPIEHDLVTCAFIDRYFVILPKSNPYHIPENYIIQREYLNSLLYTYRNPDLVRLNSYLERIKSNIELLKLINQESSESGLSVIEVMKRYAKKLMDEDYKNERIKFYKEVIRNSPEWLDVVKDKAKKKGISLDEMIMQDATYMYEQEIK